MIVYVFMYVFKVLRKVSMNCMYILESEAFDIMNQHELCWFIMRWGRRIRYNYNYYTINCHSIVSMKSL